MNAARARRSTIVGAVTIGALPGIVALAVLVGVLFGLAQARGGQDRTGAAAWAKAELDYLRAQGYEGLAPGARMLTPPRPHPADATVDDPSLPSGFDHAVITVRSIGVDEKQVVVTLYQAPAVVYATVSTYVTRRASPGRGM